MKVIFLSTLIILAGASISPAYAQELLWESKETITSDHKETINKNIESLEWVTLTDTGRQLSPQSDNMVRTDNIVWEISPYSFQRDETEARSISKKTVIKSNHQKKKLK